MRASLIGALLAATLFGADLAAALPQKGSVWTEQDGRTHALDALPDHIDGRSLAAVTKWLECLSESHTTYTAEVLAGGEGVYVLPPPIVIKEPTRREKGSTRADRQRKLDRERKKREKEEAERLAREGPPPPPEETRRAHLANVRATFEEKLPASKVRQVFRTQWGKDVQRCQRDMPVIVMVRDREDFHRVLDGVLEANPYMASHVAHLRASKVTGAIFEKPLLGIVIQAPEESEEHRPWNEIAKKEVELRLFKRFGPQPFFVREGISWYFEWEEFETLRTFTGRTEFIGIDDPAYEGWPNDRAALFWENGDLHLDSDRDVMTTLRAWRSDGYEDQLAAASYQLVRCLMEDYSEKVSDILAGWGADTAEKRGSNTSGGQWTLDPSFVLSTEDLMNGLQGVELLESVREFEK